MITLVFKTAITSTFSSRRQTDVCFQSCSECAAVFQPDLKQADRQKDCTQQSSFINNKEIPLCRCSLTHWGKLVCVKEKKRCETTVEWNKSSPPSMTLMRHVGSKLRLWVILCSPSHITKSRLHHSSKLYRAHSSFSVLTFSYFKIWFEFKTLVVIAQRSIPSLETSWIKSETFACFEKTVFLETDVKQSGHLTTILLLPLKLPTGAEKTTFLCQWQVLPEQKAKISKRASKQMHYS